MNEPEVDLLYAETVDADRGDGFRIYTSRDEVYEALEDDDVGVASRIHPERGEWRSTVRLPAEDRQETYATFRAVADRVEDAYDADLPMDWLTFQEDFETGSTRVRDGDITLRYNAESGVSVPEVRYDTYGGPGTMAGMLSGGFGPLGAGLVGGAAGVLPPETILLGIPGMFAGMAAGWGIGYLGPKTRQWHANRKRRKRYGDAEGMTDAALIDQINEQRGLEELLSRDEPFPDRITDRYNELDGEELSEAVSLMQDVHFDQFPDVEGITATGTFASYEEAARFQDLVRDREQQDREQPSIYTHPEAFRSLFDHLTFTVEGEQYVLEDAYQLTAELLGREEADPEIAAWLEADHPDIVKQAGQEHALHGDAR